MTNSHVSERKSQVRRQGRARGANPLRQKFRKIKILKTPYNFSKFVCLYLFGPFKIFYFFIFVQFSHPSMIPLQVLNSIGSLGLLTGSMFCLIFKISSNGYLFILQCPQLRKQSARKSLNLHLKLGRLLGLFPKKINLHISISLSISKYIYSICLFGVYNLQASNAMHPIKGLKLNS